MPDDGAPQIAQIEDYRPKPKRFQLTRFRDVRLSTERPYLIKDLLPREGLAVIWGPPKCGKSFWVFDLVMHVALGWNYRGRRVKSGTVCYVACEGERGLSARIEAFRIAKLSEEDADPNFYLLTTRLDLVADVEELITDIRIEIGTQECAAIVIDTLNRSIAGSESNDQDMGSYVKAADRLREAFGAAVIIVHHCGTNSSRPRGHTSLTGAADVQIAVSRDAAGLITATVEYLKDGAEGEVATSRLLVVDVGTDEDSEPITSCVIEDAAGSITSSPQAPLLKLGPKERIALDTLQKAINAAGRPAPVSSHIPAGVYGVEIDTWRRFYQAGTSYETSEARKKAFQRAREKLQAERKISIFNDFIWITSQG